MGKGGFAPELTDMAPANDVEKPQARRLSAATAAWLEEQGDNDWGKVTTSVRVEDEGVSDAPLSKREEAAKELAELAAEGRRLRSLARRAAPNASP